MKDEPDQMAPVSERLPCHQAVNKAGRPAPGWGQQRTLLEAEGVAFKASGHAGMVSHLWQPDEQA